MGLWLVPLVTLVIWGTASVMCVVTLTPRWLSTLRRRLIRGPARSSQSQGSGVWDEWLDSPVEGIVPISDIGDCPGLQRTMKSAISEGYLPTRYGRLTYAPSICQ